MQHVAGHLLQTTSILDLTGQRITRPKLARLADTINRQGQTHLQQLQQWLDVRGWPPTTPKQQPSSGKQTHLQRLSWVGVRMSTRSGPTVLVRSGPTSRPCGVSPGVSATT
jgi:hypothetical protein